MQCTLTIELDYCISNLTFILQDKIMRVTYVWALCRDQEELNPRAAWKLLDISASNSEQFL